MLLHCPDSWGRLPGWSLVQADGLRVAKDVALHCLKKYLFCWLPQVWQDYIQGIKLMEVAMATYGWAGATVACFFAVIATFQSA